MLGENINSKMNKLCRIHCLKTSSCTRHCLKASSWMGQTSKLAKHNSPLFKPSKSHGVSYITVPVHSTIRVCAKKACQDVNEEVWGWICKHFLSVFQLATSLLHTHLIMNQDPTAPPKVKPIVCLVCLATLVR